MIPRSIINLCREVVELVEKAMATHFQYSCLANPMDGGAWWAAVHGVARSRTRLKKLSSSSSGVTQFYLLIPRCLIISPVHLLCDVLFGSIQLFSQVQLFETPWTAACQVFPSVTNSQSLLKLMSIRVSDVIQPSHPLSSPSPAFNLSQHEGLFQ